MQFFAQDNWNTLMQFFGYEQNSATYEKLKNLHAEKHRAYHNAVHIEACIKHLYNANHLFEEDKLQKQIELAFWFHDAIYSPFKKDNELKSAELCRDFLQDQSTSPETIEFIFELIMATRHSVALNNQAEEIMVDIDLSILGGTESNYKVYYQNVRQEYKWVPAFLYKKNRRKLLKSFLERDNIYQTPYFRQMWENNARRNLAAEIAILT